MATMSNRHRRSVWRVFMSRLSGRHDPLEVGKSDQLDAVGDADQWASDNQASFNAALSEPFRSAASTSQKAELLREVLSSLDEDYVLEVLPESRESLHELASLGQADLAAHLQAWQAAQSARLKHLQFQLLPSQLAVVEEALRQLLPIARESKGDNPNTRGTALYLLCSGYLKRERMPA